MATEIVELPEGIARTLRRKDDDGVTTLTLNRPKSGNSLSHRLVHELQDTLDEIRDDRSVRVVILAAAGRLFCTGHDLNESVEAMKTPETKREATATCSRMMQSLIGLPQPVIAKVHSIATAAGCELVASCDLVYASSEAKFATPGVNIGFWCHSPQVAVSRAVAPKHAMQMLLTGKMVDAETAFRMGLVSEVVEPDKLNERVDEVARLIASKSAYAIAQGKRSFYRQLEMDRGDAYDYAGEVIYRTIQADDAREGITAFLEKRDPRLAGFLSPQALRTLPASWPDLFRPQRPKQLPAEAALLARQHREAVQIASSSSGDGLKHAAGYQ